MSLYYVNGGFITHTLCNNFTAILQITLYLGKKAPLLCMVSSRWHWPWFMILSVLVLVGIMICSRIAALSAIAGSAIGVGISWLVGVPASVIEQGLYGFNPALTFSAMLMFYVPSINSVCVGMIASIITVFIQLALSAHLEPYGLPCMVSYFMCHCFDYFALLLIKDHWSLSDTTILFWGSIIYHHSRHYFKHDCSSFVINNNPRRPLEKSASSLRRISSSILGHSCINAQNKT